MNGVAVIFLTTYYGCHCGRVVMASEGELEDCGSKTPHLHATFDLGFPQQQVHNLKDENESKFRKANTQRLKNILLIPLKKFFFFSDFLRIFKLL